MLTLRRGCLRWVELLGAGLAAVAVNAVALICKLVRMDLLTIRVAMASTMSSMGGTGPHFQGSLILFGVATSTVVGSAR